MALLLVWIWVKEKIMPLGAFKAGLMGASGAAAAGDVVLLSSQTASNSASLSFTSGIDSTYGEYIFGFYNINPATDAAFLTVQFNATDSTSYDETITSISWNSQHGAGGTAQLDINTDAYNQGQETEYQRLTREIGNGAAEMGAGVMHLFNPSSTTYVKHFLSRIQMYQQGDNSMDIFVGGYVNTTTAIDDAQFKMSSGNFDGKIKMWGVK